MHDSSCHKIMCGLVCMKCRMHGRYTTVIRHSLGRRLVNLLPVAQRTNALQYGVVRLMDFAILQSGLNLSDCGFCQFAAWLESLRRFRSVASLPIESHPCYPRMASQRSGSSSPSSGDPYNSEKAGASCWSPRTWHTNGNFGLRAERRCTSELCS